MEATRPLPLVAESRFAGPNSWLNEQLEAFSEAIVDFAVNTEQPKQIVINRTEPRLVVAFCLSIQLNTGKTKLALSFSRMFNSLTSSLCSIDLFPSRTFAGRFRLRSKNSKQISTPRLRTLHSNAS